MSGRENACLARKQPSNDDDEAFRQYMEKFGENRDGTNAGKDLHPEPDTTPVTFSMPGFNRKAFPWFTPKEPAKVPSVSTEAAGYPKLLQP